ncbi:succinylglutamate desuccinylase/aspartoacylase family protein [Burkholderiaceae bacterium DAT-1]|nr:succinylglutamate desuccinylase/aspartoacylase family protein [Burkholderiaceae bacterium DAT-1]
MHIQEHPLLPGSAGHQRLLHSLHFGSRQTPQKVYIQASLHADEIPGMLVAQHLRQHLTALESAGAISGEIVLVPVANPIGLSQEIQGVAFGRFDLSTGINFNRGYRHLTPELPARLDALIGHSARDNTRIIRHACHSLLSEARPATESEQLKHLLQTLSIDADIVLDLHCDNQASVHLYAGTPLQSRAMPLARYLGAEAILVSRESGDDPFDETLSRTWWELAEHYAGRFPVELDCLALTVELRGEADVTHTFAARDAAAIIEFLKHEGHVQGQAAPLPAARCEATPLEGVEPLVAPHPGIVVFHRETGEQINAGEQVAELIDPLTGHSTPVLASVSGVLFARVARRYASRGMRLAKIAGKTAYRSGKLLSM